MVFPNKPDPQCIKLVTNDISYFILELGKPSFKKIKKIMENSIIGLTPPPPPFLAKIMENFEKY